MIEDRVLVVGQIHAQITERDAAVLSWLEQVGIANTDTMMAAYSFFGGTPISKQALSRRLRRLVDAGDLGVDVLARNGSRHVYWPAARRYPIIRRDLPHDLLAAYWSIMLLTASGSEALVFNRTLPTEIRKKPQRWTKDMPLSVAGHRADGLLWLPDDTAVIVEIELAMKSARILSRVLQSHADRIHSVDDPATHVLFLTTWPVGRYIASAWRKFGHAADHPHAAQIIHAIDDALGHTTTATTIPIPI
jgi:hypothetical protein